MNDLMRAVQEARIAAEKCAAARGVPFESCTASASSERRDEPLRLALRKLPKIPDNWRQLVDGRIANAVANLCWSSGNLILLGNTGCGKTLGAAVLAKRLLLAAEQGRAWNRARRIVFVDAAKLALAREQYGFGAGEAPLIAKCESAPLLVLDELGFLDKDTGVIEQVIDARDKARRPTVVTSGMKPEELEGRYGTATARKLMGQGHQVVQVFSPS